VLGDHPGGIVDDLHRHVIVEGVERRGRRAARPYVARHVAGQAFVAHGGDPGRQRFGDDRNQVAHVSAGDVGQVGVENGLVGVFGEAGGGVGISHE
jgi:hypothetical protein